MLFNQDYFEQHRPYFDYLEMHWISREWCLGLLAAVTTIATTIGLCISAVSRSEDDLNIAFLLRLIGWSGYVMIYGAVCISISIADLHSLASIFSVLAFSLSVTGFLMGPAMPDDAR